jgi:hypothetical protein
VIHDRRRGSAATQLARTTIQFDEDSRSSRASVGYWSAMLLFDIVNGFLKSMPRGIGFERSDGREAGATSGVDILV